MHSKQSYRSRTPGIILGECRSRSFEFSFLCSFEHAAAIKQLIQCDRFTPGRANHLPPGTLVIFDSAPASAPKGAE